MSKRRTRLDEDDLKDFLAQALKLNGYLDEDAKVIGIEFKTKKIKKGGDYYKDGVDDPEYPGEVEVVQWVKVLSEVPKKRSSDEPEGE